MKKLLILAMLIANLVSSSGCMCMRVKGKMMHYQDFSQDQSRIVDTLMEADRTAARISMERSIEAGFRSLLTEDAIQLPHGSEPVFGKENICKAMAKLDGKYKLDWSPVDGDVASSGDMGWTWGNYTLSWEADGTTKEMLGKYLSVWVKDKNGDWKAKVDIGNSTPKK